MNKSELEEVKSNKKVRGKKVPLKIIPLGGLGEIGKNMTAFEYNDEIIVIDCGLAFPDEDLYGIDSVIPDVTFLIKNKEKVKGIFITHGHEDHIGALPYILKQINIPVYGTKMSLGLIEIKLKDHKMLNDCTLVMVEPGELIKLDNFKVEFIRNNHSIPDSCSIALHTPIGVAVHSGDFKVDFTPIDEKMMNLQRYAELGKRGVLLLMADSTNALHKGYTMSEKSVGETLEHLFSKASGRIIVSTFASNVHRLQQISDCSIKYGRKIAFSGRGMENVSEAARALGYLFIPEDMIISLDEIKNYPNDKLTIVTTGSQGESMAALTRIAASTHRHVHIQEGDMVIISAAPIPGNEKAVSNVINDLIEKGANVIYKAIQDIHVSGHACEQELRLIQALLKPKFFVPVHGEYRHLFTHAKIAQSMGVDKANTFILENGDVLELNKTNGEVTGKVPFGRVLVDGMGVGDIGNMVLRDRKNLAENGIITVVVAIDMKNKIIISGPDIVSRGFVYVRNSEELIDQVRDIVTNVVESCLDRNITQWAEIKNSIRREVDNFVYDRMKRKPMILPVIVEI
ncbi:ribonuclease J [Clostridium saccharoperbutylacetonicum]|uniref:Ribonuclease J n=1 Tax=Clostridium saccharoperbutylacetonicum N1-4(HMT) TaxID=931276 RepID=M1MV92_9CLOT|nr:ribonuclease J [Clostridium saccharoperbutylacetonicum]AGF55432.1 ribonuclease J 1 [Clostridium saccharoperbutylacetonicum N1-4(HMT)]AQR94333.1 ribonuclease J 1 [Clostridium saccharoperbutylacetonicum]NRT63854.1 beta-CASP RNase J family ribonuclease [Clostridium saccharoperbutylacetonicum]NSB27217.1 beta-CASP RNase J family ribonuclease [Clostridium saccharoperbutylacetonicum]NSB30032.1 beta-CASP RNase J family ribonuclease [Clostridium saccharoperbutylacetonicum]